MLITYIKINVLPEKRIEFEQTVFALRNEFRKTKGCLSYNIYKDTEHDTAYFLMGEWQKQDVMENHFQTSSLNVLLGAINNLCEPPEVNIRIASLLDNNHRRLS
jgi:quinol monooxygenase YgiN